MTTEVIKNTPVQTKTKLWLADDDRPPAIKLGLDHRDLAPFSGETGDAKPHQLHLELVAVPRRDSAHCVWCAHLGSGSACDGHSTTRTIRMAQAA